MNELIESLRQQINERLNSPLVGAYVMAWLVFNYKIIVVLMYDMEPSAKFAEIGRVIRATGLGWPIEFYGIDAVFLVPMLAALFYVFVMPFPSYIALMFNLTMNKWTKELQVKISKQQIKTLEDFEAQAARYGAKISMLEAAVEQSEKMQDKLRSDLAELEKKSNEKDLNMRNLQTEIRRENEDLRNKNKELRSRLDALLNGATPQDLKQLGVNLSEH